MEWQTFVDEGIVRPAPGSRPRNKPTIRRAWDRVVEARSASLAFEWEIADAEIRRAFCVATDALAFYYDYTTGGTCSFEAARRIGAEYFGERVSDPIFEKACKLQCMMPLGRNIDEECAREVRRCVASSSEYVALVECHTFRS